MLLNCDSASKMVKNLSADRDSLIEKENTTKMFIGTAKECRDAPEYDFATAQAEQEAIAEKIYALKHAINVFNTTTVLDGLGYTVDEGLVRMAFLSERKRKLNTMRTAKEKDKPFGYRGASLGAEQEYVFRMYSDADAEAEYQKVVKELTELQQAINIANLTKTFEVNI